MSGLDPAAAAVIAKARGGDVAGAIAAGEALLATRGEDGGLRFFVGVMLCRHGDLRRGIGHLRAAVRAEPRNEVARIELARALLADGEAEAALAAAGPPDPGTPPGRERMRVRAQALLALHRADAARDDFETLARLDPGDYESRNGAGVARLALGDPQTAVAWFDQAVRLRPTVAAFHIHLSRARAEALDWIGALAAADGALALAPDDAGALLAAARAHAGLGARARSADLLDRAVAATARHDSDFWCDVAEIHGQRKDLPAAEAGFARALATAAPSPRAWIGMGNALERLNRYDDLERHVDAATAAGVPAGSLALLRARLARRRGDLAAAFALAKGADGADPATRAQLVGTIADRLGEHRAAAAAFAEANAHIAAATAVMEADAERNLASYARMQAMLTPAWLRDWPPARSPRPDDRRDPLFIFGFPRSGTTLIDTMLGGHPDTAVMEEEGVIQGMAERIGSVERVPAASAAEIDALRDAYYAEVDRRIPDAAGRLVIDKEPLGLSSTLLLHRLFPGARFVFAERHPCDVVLSCYMTSLRFDQRVGRFHDVASIARLYDAVMAFWQHCATMLPIAVATVRYERLVVDPERELRALAGFAGLDWRPALLTNQDNAAKRRYIGSPSYAQVAEPLYTRAAGRWTRYPDLLAPAMPLLQPWIERLGYDG